MVNQVNRLGGRLSMKISHSASPRNRSSRSSRSPPTGNEIAGNEAAAAAASRAIASVGPASGGPATRSAMVVIWHRLENRFYPLARPEQSFRPAGGKQDTGVVLQGCG